MKNKIYLFALVFLLPFSAHAATLSIVPVTGSFSSGQVFQASVYVSSPTEAINAVQGTVSFPAQNLEVLSLSKSGSIVGLWVQEPTFSNLAGQVNLEGVVLNPGFIGASGKVLTITFRTKAAGSVPVIFSSSSVLANDGQGTNVLKSFAGSTYIVGDKVTQQGAADATSALGELGTPSSVVITSATHPDSASWYTRTMATLSWKLPQDATAVRYAFDHNARTTPSADVPGLITTKTFTDLEDGVWYMHVRVENDKGWGAVSHFRVAIDTIPPTPFKVKVPEGTASDDPTPVVDFHTVDKGSGVDHYVLKVGDNDLLTIKENEVSSNSYRLSPQLPGKHTLLVQAVDKAGNITTETGEFEIISIIPPTILEMPSSIVEGNILHIKGTTYPNSMVNAHFINEKREIETESIHSTQTGEFEFIWTKQLDRGVYTATFDVVDARGATSVPTEPRTLEVKRRALFAIGSLIVDYVSIGLFLAFCIAGLFFLGWYLLNKTIMFKTRMRKELHRVDHDFHKAFQLLSKDFEEEIKNLEGVRSMRDLTREEERIVKKMRQNLADAEEFLEEDLRKLEDIV
ncbi:MAG: cohesin domain-containing protein [Patescibacteria group bacterium]